MPANSITTTALEIIRSAMMEIGVLAAGEIPATTDQADMLAKLQRLFDRWNANEQMVYNVNFQTFALPINQTAVTIGPGAMLDVNQRPVDIESIGLMLTNATPNVKVWMNKRDQQWWAAQRIPALTSTYPTDFYYSPDWPVGNIYFWPVPTAANNILVQSRIILTEITTYNQAFTLPPGYWDATVYALAESLCPMFTKEPSPTLLRLKAEAIRNVESNNISSPRGTVADAGMPGTGVRGGFNYLSGLPSDWNNG